MRIASWNVNSLKARMPRVEEWILYARPDVLCLQETKMADASFPHMSFAALGYESAHHGNGRWNGVAILSRVGLSQVERGFRPPIAPDTDTRLISAQAGPIKVMSVYVPNGRSLEDDHYRYKLDWLARLRSHLEASADPAEALAVCGDFNIAPCDLDVWSAAAFEGCTHVSEPERQSLRQLQQWGLRDVFRDLYPGEEGLYSYWDYRAGDFHEHRGMRIDLILVTQTLAKSATWALVDRNARKGRQPSDHAPVLVDLDLSS